MRFSPLLLILSFLWDICLAEGQTNDRQATNHVIRFAGMKNGYGNKTLEAISDLTDNLRNITGRADIKVDSLDENGAEWHIESLAAQADCPESEINNLLANIQEPSGEYTRKFKMGMTEEFEMPSSIVIDWMGACARGPFKRSQVVGLGRAPAVVSGGDAEPTGGANSSTSFQETPEPVQPSTTPDPPTSKAAFESPANETAAQGGSSVELTTNSARESSLLEDEAEPENTTLSFSPLDTALAFSSSIFDAPLASNVTADNTTTLPTTPEVAAAAKTTTSPTTTTTSIPTTPAPPSTTASSATESPTTKDDEEETQPSTETTTSSDGSFENDTTETELDGGLEANQKSQQLQHSTWSTTGLTYGKYIGLAAAFIVIVSYLIYSRAFKKHESYELQN